MDADRGIADRGITDAVTQALRHTPLTDEDVEAIVVIVQGLGEKGLTPRRVFPKGLPTVDGAWLEVEATLEVVPEIVNLLTLEQRIEEIRMHSIGVPASDAIVMRIGVR